MRDVVVELRDVFCVHRTGQGDAAALQGAELQAFAGEVLCVLGPSGAGKSTLLRVIAGLQTPSAGIVRVIGSDIGRQGERARAAFRHRHLGLLGQASEATLSPDLPIRKAVELPLLLRRKLDLRGRRARVQELLETVGLSDRANSLPEELSGGERQRTALCVAMAHYPTLLLADEPTGELDRQSADGLLQTIAALASAESMSVIIATHDQATADLADRTLTISGGRIAQESSRGQNRAVVSKTGWIRLPPGFRAGAGIGDRATIEAGEDAVMVRRAGESRARETTAPTKLGLPDDLTAAEVDARAIDFGYGRERRVLDAFSHEFRAGRMTVITGRSGSGKTTLLRLIAGLDRVQAGELVIDGQALSGLDREALASMRRRRIGYMPQEPAAVSFLSAFDNLTLALQIRGADLDDAASRAAQLLAALAIGGRARQLVGRLSAGEIQRVALARALGSAGGLLILDEPTSRLDEANANLVGAVLAQAAQDGQTVICASHDPQIISQADEVMAVG